MKRILSTVLAVLVLAAALVACGGTKEVDLAGLLSDINTKYSFSDLKNIEDTDMLNRYYQIDQNGVKQFAAELSTTASQYTEVVIVEANDAAAAEAVAAQLNNHLDSQLNTAKSYDAAQVSMIENCKVKQEGNYVYLVVSDRYDAIIADIEAALK